MTCSFDYAYANTEAMRKCNQELEDDIENLLADVRRLDLGGLGLLEGRDACYEIHLVD